MNKIAFSNMEDNIFLYIDTNSKLNIMENFNNLEYTDNPADKITAEGVNISYTDEYILYKNSQYGMDVLSIISFNNLNLGEFENIHFKFQCTRILNIVVSKVKNLFAIQFIADDSYNVFMNGEYVSHQVNQQGSYYVQVYDFSQHDSRRIFKWSFNKEVLLALSDIDTLAVSKNDRFVNTLTVFDIYNETQLMNINNIISVIDARITCMHYMPSNDEFINHLVILTKKSETEEYNLRVIDLRGDSYSEIWNNIVPSIIKKIVISEFNGRIALGGVNEVLLYDLNIINHDNESFGAAVRVSFPNRTIDSLSFSHNELYLALEVISENEDIRTNTVSVVSLLQEQPGVESIRFTYPLEQRIELSDVLPRVPHPLNIDTPHGESDALPTVPYNINIDNPHGDEFELPLIQNPIQINMVSYLSPKFQIEDPELDTVVPIPPNNPEKLMEHNQKTCFDFLNISEENIGDYLTADLDNIVIFYKESDRPDFFIACYTFTRLKTFLKDSTHLFYKCVKRKDYRAYSEKTPDYIKIPTTSGNLFVSYQDMKTKYMQRQNMIFLEYSSTVKKTISHDSSFNHAFVSGNHCQEGSEIRVYDLIF